MDNRFKEVDFTSEYIMDTSGFWKYVKISFITLGVIIGLIALVKACIYVNSDRLDTD